MSWTKRQFITQAFEELGLASYVFDIQPEQLQAAVRRLDSMIASWDIKLGYPLPGSPENSDIDDETNVPDVANMAIYQNLAIALAPTFGKVVSVETKVSAKRGLDALMAKLAIIPVQKMPQGWPMGAGHKNTDQPFTAPASDNTVSPPERELEFYPWQR